MAMVISSFICYRAGDVGSLDLRLSQFSSFPIFPLGPALYEDDVV